MARFNKIHLGPADRNLPQVHEALASVDLKPGRLVVLSSGKFALAAADTVGKVWLVQDDYLTQRGVDADIKANDTANGLELQDGHLYAARIANSTNVSAVGTPLKLAANGLLAVATPATDRVVAYSAEIYNNTSGSEQLLKIRVAGTPGAQGPKGDPGE